MNNVDNDFYARDTSKKIRAVMRAKGNSGEHLCTNLPYGYRKDPEDKKRWIVDEEAAEVVKRIFTLCVDGKGPMQIAKLLTADKLKKRLNNAPENYRVFPDTQPAIVDEKVFERVQELRENKRRPAKQAEQQGLFSAEYEAEQKELTEFVKTEQTAVDTYEQDRADFDRFAALQI